MENKDASVKASSSLTAFADLQASVKMASAGRRKEKCKKIVEEPRKPLDFLRGSWTFLNHSLRFLSLRPYGILPSALSKDELPCC
ncbi:MAG: hypothetical protein QW220_05920 [Candidatus Bathyarchaeia archaeon]